MESVKTETAPMGVPGEPEETKTHKHNPLFSFMAVGSLIYAFFYTLFLYQNSSGITYPFFVGGTCFFFFFYLKKSGITAKKFSIFLAVSLILLGISTCMTDAWTLIFFNKLGIFLLFFYMVLHCLYEDKKWDLGNYLSNICNVICTSLIYVFNPFMDFAAYRKEKCIAANKKEGKGKYVLFGTLIALPLLLVILLLLGSADAVFGNLLDKLFSFEIDESWGKRAFQTGALFLFAFFSSYCLMCRLSNRNLKENLPDKRTAEPVIAITFTGILSFVYAVFCLIQVIYLFGGLGTLPADYTYASYAREGFFQLVFVCIINLSMVLICKKRFRENIILKAILTFICGCTYIMILSSTYRMILYIQVYQLTFLCVFVLWALLVIFLLVTGALVMIYKDDFPLVKYYVVTVTVLYLIFSFSHPDYWIARYNLNHSYTISQGEDGNIYYGLAENQDFHYLRRLSLDAAPAIFDKMEEIEANSDLNIYSSLPQMYWWWFDGYAGNLIKESYHNKIGFPLEEYHYPKKMSLRKFNFSRQMAYNTYTDYYDSHPDFSEKINSIIYE